LQKIIKKLNALRLNILQIYYSKIFNSPKSTTFFGKIEYYNPSKITIGENCSINIGVFFNVSNRLVIGNNVTISANVFITTTGLNLDYFPSKQHYSDEVVICDDVWIGAGVIILPGIKVKKGCVIGAGSVVTKDTDEFCIYAGNPAKKIRSFKSEN
jgi:acetyltransferase-like isoleucine patch superfamily enzyme